MCKTVGNPWHIRCILDYGFWITDHTRNGVNHAGQNVIVQYFTPSLVWSEYKVGF